MLEASNYEVKIIRLPSVDRQASQLLSENQLFGLMAYLAEEPDKGIVIPDTGGLRRMSWPEESRTGSAGAQIIYFFHDLNMPIYILAVYGGSERLVFTAVEKFQFAAVVKSIVERHWKDDVDHRVAKLIANG